MEWGFPVISPEKMSVLRAHSFNFNFSVADLCGETCKSADFGAFVSLSAPEGAGREEREEGLVLEMLSGLV